MLTPPTDILPLSSSAGLFRLQSDLLNVSLVLGERNYPTGYCPIDRGSELPTV